MEVTPLLRVHTLSVDEVAGVSCGLFGWGKGRRVSLWAVLRGFRLAHLIFEVCIAHSVRSTLDETGNPDGPELAGSTQ